VTDANHRETLVKQAIANGWPQDLANFIADQCDGADFEASLAVADQVRSYCLVAGYPDQTAADLFALGFTQKAALDALRQSISNKQGFLLHVASLSTYRNGKNSQ
jgi:hypothetical protein